MYNIYLDSKKAYDTLYNAYQKMDKSQITGENDKNARDEDLTAGGFAYIIKRLDVRVSNPWLPSNGVLE